MMRDSVLPNRLAIVDVETTGGNFLYDRIIEVGIVRVENGQVVKTYKSLVNPECSLPPEIISITGIQPYEVESAPTFAELATDIQELITDSVFVAHNARFDYSFLRSEFKRLDTAFNAKNLCTVKLSRTLFPEATHHNLSAIIDRCQLTCLNRHRALDDAQAVWDFLQFILRAFPPKTIQTAISQVFKRPAKPILLPEATLDSLPDGPGVYIFYGENKLPLYIGKSLDIRSRVLDHFSGSISSPRKLQLYQQIKDIDFIETAGELGALLLESNLIKKLQPLYNRMLRHSHEMLLVTKEAVNGYDQIKLKKIRHLDYITTTESFGIFRSLRQAKQTLAELAADHQLCDRFLGLEKTTSACFRYRLGECRGACSGKESAAKYNLRQLTALTKLKITTWPFSGPIAIPEKNIFNHKIAVHIFHLWAHLGTYESIENFSENHPAPRSPTAALAKGDEVEFDLDTYHILKRYLRKSTHNHLVRQL